MSDDCDSVDAVSALTIAMAASVLVLALIAEYFDSDDLTDDVSPDSTAASCLDSSGSVREPDASANRVSALSSAQADTFFHTFAPSVKFSDSWEMLHWTFCARRRSISLYFSTASLYCSSCCLSEIRDTAVACRFTALLTSSLTCPSLGYCWNDVSCATGSLALAFL